MHYFVEKSKENTYVIAAVMDSYDTEFGKKQYLFESNSKGLLEEIAEYLKSEEPKYKDISITGASIANNLHEVFRTGLYSHVYENTVKEIDAALALLDMIPDISDEEKKRRKLWLKPHESLNVLNVDEMFDFENK